MKEFLANLSLIPRDLIAIPLMALVFVGFWRAFGALVVKRHLALYQAREKASVGAKQSAEENLDAAAKLHENYESRLALEMQTIGKSLEQKIVTARSEAMRIIESAEAEAATLIESTRNTILSEQSRLISIIERDAESLATTISEKALA